MLRSCSKRDRTLAECLSRQVCLTTNPVVLGNESFERQAASGSAFLEDSLDRLGGVGGPEARPVDKLAHLAERGA